MNDIFQKKKSLVLLKKKVSRKKIKWKKPFKALISRKQNLGVSRKKVSIKNVYKKIKYLLQNTKLNYNKKLPKKYSILLKKKPILHKNLKIKKLWEKCTTRTFATSKDKKNSKRSNKIKSKKMLNENTGFNKRFSLTRAKTELLGMEKPTPNKNKPFGSKNFKPKESKSKGYKGSKSNKTGPLKPFKNNNTPFKNKKKVRKFNRTRPTWWKRRWVFFYWQKKTY